MVLAHWGNPKSPEHADVGELKQRMRAQYALFLVVLDKEKRDRGFQTWFLGYCGNPVG